MSDEEPEPVSESDVDFPITHMETLYIDLHQDYLAAMTAGFSDRQAFTLTKILFKTRLNMTILSGVDDE